MQLTHVETQSMIDIVDDHNYLAHLLESIFQNQLGVWLGPFLVQDKHVFTLCLWISIRVYQAINAHSGYDLPYITSQYYFP
ncbi:unnamed protein product [Rotaria sp. Silwood2]|nr:unnamed protein product [Rotaria sp. Silwood2]